MTTYVVNAVSPDSIVLTIGENGWEPSHAQVKPGGTVEWRAPGLEGWVYLMFDGYDIRDSVYVKSGSATRRFESKVLVRYCAGDCWGSWGAIFVR